MSGIGELAAVLGIAVQLGDFSQSLKRSLRTLTHAQKEVKDVYLEVSNFSSLLQLFRRTAKSIPSNASDLLQEAKSQKLIDKLIEQSSDVRDSIKEYTVKVKSLRKDKTTVIARCRARLQWFLNKGDVLLMRASMDSVKHSLNLFSIIIHLNITSKNLDMLQQPSQDLLDEM